MEKHLLDNDPKIATGFSVPENYFEDFEQNSTHLLPKQKTVIIQLFSEYKNWFIGAAAIITMTSALLFTFTSDKTADVTEVENQLLYNSTITDDDIVNLLDEKAISAIKVDTLTDFESLEANLINEATIENYLSN